MCKKHVWINLMKLNLEINYFFVQRSSNPWMFPSISTANFVDFSFFHIFSTKSVSSLSFRSQRAEMSSYTCYFTESVVSFPHSVRAHEQCLASNCELSLTRTRTRTCTFRVTVKRYHLASVFIQCRVFHIHVLYIKLKHAQILNKKRRLIWIVKKW